MLSSTESLAKGASARVNLGPPVETSAPGTYFELRRNWKAGDTVDLDIPMPVQRIEANPLVEDTLNQVAVKRGPVVYCLESSDLPKDIRVMEVSVPANVDLQARCDERLLDGVAVVDGTLLARPAGEWQGQLYRELQTSAPKPVKLQLIPYFVWANRGKSEMSVWLRQEQRRLVFKSGGCCTARRIIPPCRVGEENLYASGKDGSRC